MKQSDPRLKASLDFITENFHATFDSVPRELREQWYYDPNSDNEDQKDFAWQVFMSVYIIGKKMQGVQSFTTDEDKLSELFGNWQVALAAAEINEVTDIKIKPFKIFDVENLSKEKLEIRFT